MIRRTLHATGMAAYLGLMFGVWVALVLLPGCASITTPDGSKLKAVGANSRASIHQCSVAADPETASTRTVEVNEPATLEYGAIDSVRRAFGADVKLPRKVTTTTEPYITHCALLHEVHGSGFLEPLADTIRAGGEALGVMAGKLIVCVFTAGIRCGT